MIAPDEAARAQLVQIFRAALASVDGGAVVRDAFRREGGRLFLAGEAMPRAARLRLVAVGKAAAPMAAAFAEIAGDALVSGLVVTNDTGASAPARTRLVVAAHPVPDTRCVAAAAAVIDELEAAAPEERVCVLLSGGTSSLLASPVPGVTLEELAATTRALLSAGADIAQTNAVRRCLTRASGGRLARHCAAGRVAVLAISDVPGDALEIIGSGPFAATSGAGSEAATALRDLGLLEQVAASVRARAESQQPDAAGLSPGDAALERVTHHIVGSNRVALEAARAAALRAGLEVRLLAAPLAGEARAAGSQLAQLARRLSGHAPVLLLAGGETHVRVRGTGLGGRNQELALAAAIELAGSERITLLAAGTDGIDGPTDAAGAFADGGSAARGAAAGVAASAALEANDSHTFFAAEGGLLRTGVTGTNVMDLALALVGAAPGKG